MNQEYFEFLNKLEILIKEFDIIPAHKIVDLLNKTIDKVESENIKSKLKIVLIDNKT